MISRYFEIKDFIPKLYFPAVEEPISTDSDDRKLQELLQNLEPMEGISLELQKNGSSMEHERVCLNTAIKKTVDELSPPCKRRNCGIQRIPERRSANAE